MRKVAGLIGACALVALVNVPPARADKVAVGARAELGVELDSNPARYEVVNGTPVGAIVASPAGRVVIAAEGMAALGERWVLSLSGSQAGKVFARDADRDEDVLVTQAQTAAQASLSPHTSFTAAFGYYDAFQRRTPDARDFRSLAPSGRLEQSIGRVRLWGGGGYRWFTFKEDDGYSFSGPTAFAGARVALASAGTDPDGADWDVSLNGSFESRAFVQSLCVNATDCPPATSLGERRDQFLMSQIELTRTAGWLFGVGFAAHDNLSNSYGEGLHRWVGFARATTLLPWSLSLSGRVDVFVTRYNDNLVLARDQVSGQPLASLEDESKTTARVELARSLGEHTELALRYTYYTSAPTSGPVSYERQVLLINLTVTTAR